MAFVHVLDLDNGSGSLIPPDSALKYDEIRGFAGGRFYTVGAGPGAGFTLAYKNFYLTPIIFFCVGPQYHVLNLADKDKKGGHISMKFESPRQRWI